MRAARFTRFGGPDVLEIVDAPEPHPGPGQVRLAVQACGVTATDRKTRAGLLGGDLPQTTGRDVAGVVDELGPGVTELALGDTVFGSADEANGAAEFTLATHVAPLPAPFDVVRSAALPSALETATRSLDALRTGAGATVLVNGATGGVGSAAVQLAVARGWTVIGIAGPTSLGHLRALGAQPVAYGPGLVDRVLALAPAGVDAALDVAGSGVLPELVELAHGAAHVVTISDFAGAKAAGVHFSTGEDGRAFRAYRDVAPLVASGRFDLPVAATFPLAAIAEAHRLGDQGHVRGRIVLTIG